MPRRSQNDDKTNSSQHSSFGEILGTIGLYVRAIWTFLARIFTLPPEKKAEKAADQAHPFWEENEEEAPPVPEHDPSPFAKSARLPNPFVGVTLYALRLFIVLGLLAGMAGMGAVFGIAKAYMDTTPPLDLNKLQDVDLTSFLYDGNGALITTLSGMENRLYAPIGEIPLDLQHAVVATEDERFYAHNGVDIKRIIGSFLSNLQNDSTSGGSTITQQLIKMKLLSSERTYKRKIQEAWLAMQLENTYSKDQILEAYLNEVPLGQSDYGVKAAAQDYFGKDLSQLTLRECAMLAGLGQLPNTYDPRLNTYSRNRMDLTDRRTDTVLSRMYDNGYITKEQYDAALNEKVTILEKSPTKQMYDMPYFVEYAMQDVITSMLKFRGMDDTSENRSAIQQELRTGGYNIYTTVDPTIQGIVEDTLFNWDKYPAMRYSQDRYTLERTSDSSFIKVDQPQAAAVVIDQHTAEIKAIVGGRSQPTQKYSFNRAYQSNMPVGSSIKPLTVYGPALDMGLSPAQPFYDVPLPVTGWDNDKGYPSNYGGGFSGIVTMREGIINSLNVVAAHILMDHVTVNTSAAYLASFGVTMDEHINKDGAGLALGTSGITPLEMAGAYTAIANTGVYKQPLSFSKVVDKDGRVILDANSVRDVHQVLKQDSDFMLVDMMKDAVNEGSGSRAKISGVEVAGKTGTNSDFRGVFFAGITPYYTATVWVGQDDYKPLYSGAQGGRDAAPLWQAFMSKIIKQKNLSGGQIISGTAEDYGLVKKTVCAVSGLLATDACTDKVTDYFRPEDVPADSCNLHHIFKIDKDTGKLATDYCPAASVEERSVLVIPSDSPLNALSDQQKAQYLPAGTIFGLDLPDDMTEFNASNPLYAKYFCPLHTESWGQYAVLVGQANQLVDHIQSRMNTDASLLTEAAKAELNQRINAVKSNLDDPAKYDALLAAYNNLKDYEATAFAANTPTIPTLPVVQQQQGGKKR